MKELTPELYTELNKTINALRKEKKELEENIVFQRNQIQSLNGLVEKQIEKIQQLTNVIYSPKLKEVNAFIQDYFSNIFKFATEHCNNHGDLIMNSKVFEAAIKSNSFIIWAYLLGDKAELDKSMLEPPKDSESLEEYLNRLKDKEK